jgi:hypothetical protein
MVMEQLVTDLCELFNIYLLLVLHFNTSINDSFHSLPNVK